MNNLHPLEFEEIGMEFYIRHCTAIQNEKIKEKWLIWNYINDNKERLGSIRKCCIELSERHLKHLCQRHINNIYNEVKRIELGL